MLPTLRYETCRENSLVLVMMAAHLSPYQARTNDAFVISVTFYGSAFSEIATVTSKVLPLA
jgi:hypothetical protein